MFLHFLSREKKTKQKKTPVSRGASHCPARRRGGRRTRKLAHLTVDSDSPRAFSRPPRRCSARDKGNQKNLDGPVKSRLFSFDVVPVFSGRTAEKLFTKPPVLGRIVFPSKTSFIFLHAQENRTKRKRPCPALSCASPKRPERAETRLPSGRLKQSARFIPSASSMLGAEQRELQNLKFKNHFQSPFAGATF
jgi:hypothetical protein